MREQAKLSRRKADRWTEDVYNNTGVGSAIDERSWAKRFAFKRDGLAAANTRYASQTVASRRNPQLQRRTRWFSMDDFCIQTGCCGPSPGKCKETTEPLSTVFRSSSQRVKSGILKTDYWSNTP